MGCTRAILILLLVLASVTHAEPMEVRRGRISAAILYHLAKDTVWPAEILSRAERINLCIAGVSALNDYVVDTLFGKEIHNRKFSISFIDRSVSLKKCHIAFIGRTAQFQLSADRRDVLTVADSANTNAIITMLERNGKFRLHLDLCRLEETSLELQNELMQSVLVVNPGCVED